jgi:anti-sigma factor RsiW
MWKTIFRKHCTEDVLLAHLDGELPVPVDMHVRRHLLSCWKCRARLAEVESQIVELARLFKEEPLLDPSRVVDGRERLELGMARCEASPKVAGLPANWRFSLTWTKPALVTAVILVVAGAGVGAYLGLARRSTDRSITPEAPKPAPARAWPAPVLPVPASPVPEPELSPPKLSVPPHTPEINRQAVAEAEVAALYALHRLRLCLGEPVEVVRRPDGSVEVRGVVGDEALLSALTANLAGVRVRVPIRINVLTASEAIRLSAPAQVPDRRDALVRQSPLPIERKLDESAGNLETGRVDRHVPAGLAAVARDAVRYADAALAEAWALRRLADRYGSPAHSEAVSPEAGRLLEEMVGDHLDALHRELARCGDAVRPVLSLAADPAAPHGGDPMWSAAEDPGDWSAAAMLAFRQVQEWNRLVHGLFAGAGLRGESVENAAASVIRAFPVLNQALNRLRQEMAYEFPGRLVPHASRRQPE